MSLSATLAGLTEADAWRAVESRDRRYDGAFVFGALTTGIYCRPSCPSRRPRRDRIVFFRGPTSARSAGFRACLRCKPDDDDYVNPRHGIVQRASAYLESHREDQVTLSELGKVINVSPSHVQRTFKAALGVSPKEYSERLQLMNAKSLLKAGEPVRRATYSSGHNSTSWLYTHGQGKLGMRPGEYKNGGLGRTVRFTVARCSLGLVMIGGTDNGVCSVSMGSSEEELMRYLKLEFPKAALVKDKKGLSVYVEQILRYIDGSMPVDLSNIPLDIRATAFQHRVWKELRGIPFGSTKTYSEIAAEIDAPSAVRAVANVCAANPVALILPCHRVLRKDGDLGGYRWGRARKEALLAKESERVKSSRAAGPAPPRASQS